MNNRKESTASIFLLALGLAMVALGLLPQWRATPISSIGFGLLGAGLAPLVRMLRMRNPEYRKRREENLKLEALYQKDERKIMLREKAAYATYKMMYLVLCLVLIVFSFANAPVWMIFTIMLLIPLQYLISLVVYRNLEKKY